ncbi:MAG: tRNA (adenosine(37)-N6)-dimethylallyltransferase MiaA, partial [Candidatus Liptonbacteria bacterium]
IGTGKVPRDKPTDNQRLTTYNYKGIPHHLLDVASPKKQFSVAEYQKLGFKVIHKLFAISHLPIICGGTGLYIDALINDTFLPNVPPDPRLRAKLEKLSVAELFTKLKELDPTRAKSIDPKNPRRLIRALEIVLKTGRPVPALRSNVLKNVGTLFGNVLKIGIKVSPKKLRERIHKRLLARMKQGMVAEARKLHRSGLSWKRMEELGLEYRYLSRYLRGMMSKEDMLSKLETEIWHYAKRQMTWWRKDKNIIGIKTEPAAVKKVRHFLSS